MTGNDPVRESSGLGPSAGTKTSRPETTPPLGCRIPLKGIFLGANAFPFLRPLDGRRGVGWGGAPPVSSPAKNATGKKQQKGGATPQPTSPTWGQDRPVEGISLGVRSLQRPRARVKFTVWFFRSGACHGRAVGRVWPIAVAWPPSEWSRPSGGRKTGKMGWLGRIVVHAGTKSPNLVVRGKGTIPVYAMHPAGTWRRTGGRPLFFRWVCPIDFQIRNAMRAGH